MPGYQFSDYDGYESGYESPGRTKYKPGKELGRGEYAAARVLVSQVPGKRKAVLAPIRCWNVDSDEIEAKFAFFKALYPSQGVELIKKGSNYRLVVPFIPGVSYEEFTDKPGVYGREKQLSNEQQIQLFLSAIKALKYCHSKNLVVVDLKRSNIHYDATSGESYLVDGGLSVKEGTFVRAKIFKLSKDEDVTRNRNTYFHIAPECWSTQNVKARFTMDIFALGGMMNRLFVDSIIPPFLQSLLTDCKNTDPAKRPTLAQLESKLLISQINRELVTLRNKIGQINQHKSERAYGQAMVLLQNLERSRDNFRLAISSGNDLNAKEQFQSSCLQAINTARPILENDLNWGAYLDNFVKRLIMGFIRIASFGCYSGTFFNLTQSDSLMTVEQFSNDLQLNHADDQQRYMYTS